MTLEMQQTLERQLKDAVESGDALRVQQAQSNILLGLMDCQRKTAERVKRLTFRVFSIVAALSGIAGFAVEKVEIFKALLH